MKKKKLGFKKYLLLFLLLCAAVLICMAGFLFLQNHSSEKQDDLQRIAAESYNGIFLSMYPIDGYAEADFSSYRGLNILKCSYEAGNLSDVSDYLDAVFATDNEITNIYLGLDSLELWNSAFHSMSRWTRALEENLLPFAAAHPEVSFEVMLPSPSLEYWLNRSEEDLELWFTTCRSLVGTLCAYGNFTCYFPGTQHWLIANPGNYAEQYNLSPTAAQKIMLFTFCDNAFQITPENTDALFASLLQNIEAEQNTPSSYADLSNWDIVFFGDSVIGNYQGSLSIPGVVSGLSGASAYNCASGGTRASVDSDSDMNFLKAVDLFIAQDIAAASSGGSSFQMELERFLSERPQNRRLCFIINYGLNDYFTGCQVNNSEDRKDITTFSGALRSGVGALQDAYPDAVIILASPNYITYFSNGSEPRSEKGGSLTDYVNAALETANEMNVLSFDTYTELGYDASNAGDFLADGCHLNEEGRFLFGEKIISFLEKNIS